MVAILTERSLGSSMWGQELYQSLVQCLRTKRIPFCDITDVCPGECDEVFVIASDRDWTRSAIRQLNRGGRIPILLCNQFENLANCVYSCVCSDVNTSMKNLLDRLKAEGKSRGAIYGVNTRSISDISKMNSLFVWKEDSFATMEVFLNDGSLEKCYESFCAQAENFDAVICANDFAAISLVKRLEENMPEKLKKLTLISCASTRLSGCYRKYITTLNMHFEQYGKAAVFIHESLKRQEYMAGMTVHVAWDLQEGNAEGTRDTLCLALPVAQDTFYLDPELQQMLIADKLLNAADEADRMILEGLLAEIPYVGIMERCFLSEGSIKYRIKRMVTVSGAESKDKMLEALRKYAPEFL